MNYKESELILQKVKEAKKILVNLHRGPDPDSFSSALALYTALTENFDKDVTVVCTDKSGLMDEAEFLPNFNIIKKVDYAKFNFNEYDLFISPDSGEWQQVVDDTTVMIPKIPLVVIDHHITNTGFGELNLIDAEATSCAEIIYLIFKDWNLNINKDLATLLLTGILTDTGGFQFSSVKPETLEHSAELMRLGAKKDEIILKLFRTRKIETLNVWGELLTRMEIDEQYKFAWSAVDNQIYKKYKKTPKLTSLFATMFGSVVNDTKFSVIILETEKGVTDISFRSREDFDVSKIALDLGGGGHKAAAAAQLRGLSFENAVTRILEVARKYARQ